MLNTKIEWKIIKQRCLLSMTCWSWHVLAYASLLVSILSQYWVLKWKWKWSCSVVSDSLHPVDCSPPRSSVHGILQARILEWVAISFSRGSSQPTDWTQVSHIAGRRFNLCATREAPFWVSVQFSSVAQLCPTLCNPSLQYARPPCPSPTPGVHSDSRPSSQWCHPAISSSVIPFSSCPQSLPASETFPMSQLFVWGGPSTGASASASFLPKKSQGWSPSEWTGWISLQSKGLLRVFSNTTVQKH